MNNEKGVFSNKMKNKGDSKIKKVSQKKNTNRRNIKESQ